ncbi:hypothetical protein JZU51_03120, partial [bacterium]|nr:hypothetical protein [bacterium]
MEKLNQPLNQESSKLANEGLMLAEMLNQLKASESAPSAIIEQIETCRDVIWKALNSYSHGGLHPLSRTFTGYPPQLSY